MKKLEMPPNLESTYIAQFLANVLPQCIEELALDQEGLRALSKRGLDRAKVEHYLALATGQELQPVFVYELRAVMDQYISSMSQGESA